MYYYYNVNLFLNSGDLKSKFYISNIFDIIYI